MKIQFKNLSSRCAQLARDADSVTREMGRVRQEIVTLSNMLQDLRSKRDALAQKRERLRSENIASIIGGRAVGKLGRSIIGGRSFLTNQLSEVISEIGRLNDRIADMIGRIEIRNRDKDGLESSLREISRNRKLLGC